MAKTLQGITMSAIGSGLAGFLTGAGCEIAFHKEPIYNAFTKAENLEFAAAYAIAGALVYLTTRRKDSELD